VPGVHGFVSCAQGAGEVFEDVARVAGDGYGVGAEPGAAAAPHQSGISDRGDDAAGVLAVCAESADVDGSGGVVTHPSAMKLRTDWAPGTCKKQIPCGDDNKKGNSNSKGNGNRRQQERQGREAKPRALPRAIPPPCR